MKLMTVIVTDESIDDALRQPKNIALLEESLERDILHSNHLDIYGNHIVHNAPDIDGCRDLFAREIKPLVDGILGASAPTPRIVGPLHFGSDTMGLVGCATILCGEGKLLANARAEQGRLTRGQFIGGLLTMTAASYLTLKCATKHGENHYQPVLFEQIVINTDIREMMIEVLSHEYTHHIQKKSGLSNKVGGVFREGHARGVQRKVVEHYASQNDASMILFYSRAIPEKHRAYEWAIQETGLPLRISATSGRKNGTPSPHAKGHAFFAIKEEQYGPSIYRMALDDPAMTLLDGPKATAKNT